MGSGVVSEPYTPPSGLTRPMVPSDAALRPSAAKIWRVKSATEVLPLVPVTATIVSGCAREEARRHQGQRAARLGRCQHGHAPGAGDIGARLDQDGGSPLGDRIGHEARAVGLGSGQRREQPAGPHLAAVGREARRSRRVPTPAKPRSRDRSASGAALPLEPCFLMGALSARRRMDVHAWLLIVPGVGRQTDGPPAASRRAQRRGNARSALSSGQAGASVRIATRSFAERARGFASTSAWVGLIGRGLSRRKLGGLSASRTRRQMARAARLGHRPLAQEVLEQAVLQRMEGDDHQTAARRQHALGGGQPAGQLAQLVVDVDAQRLEGARCRMPAGDLLAAQHARRQRGQIAGASRTAPRPAAARWPGRCRASCAPRPGDTGCRRGALPPPC